MEKTRLYSWLQVRQVDEEKRIIEGIATTPEQARDGDILETSGIQFKLPIPFLWRHKDPFGNVVAAKVGSDGISVRIQIAAAGTSEAIDEQWRMIQAGVVRGLSIGWRTLQELFDKELGGFRILKSEWLELSAVPVPADVNAMITSVRSADQTILADIETETAGQAASGQPSATVNPPVVSGQPKPKSKQRGKAPMKSFDQQIAEFETLLTEKRTAMSELMENSADGVLDEENGRAYDTLTAEAATIQTNLKRLRANKANAEGDTVVAQERTAAPVRQQSTTSPARAEAPKMEPGIGLTRMVIALINARGNHMHAAELAAQHYRDYPQIKMALRASVDAGDTTTSGWAAQLIPAAQQMQQEFLDLLRPAALIGRVPNLRRVPFNVAVPLQTGGGTYGWVGEAKAKPVTSAQFDSATLRWAKAAGIIVITRELARFSSPSAETIIRNEMIKGCATFLDTQFIDESIAEVANVHPASITRDISPETPSGTSAEAFRYDLSVLVSSFIANNQDPTMAVLLMSATTAMNLALMRNALGSREFPEISIKGGSIDGIPVIVSQTVGARLILVNASDILLADDGAINIDVSEQASVEMSTTPISGGESPVDGAVLKSLWQNNLVGLRVETFMTWKRARTSAVAWLNGVAYAPTAPGSPV